MISAQFGQAPLSRRRVLGGLGSAALLAAIGQAGAAINDALVMAFVGHDDVEVARWPLAALAAEA